MSQKDAADKPYTPILATAFAAMNARSRAWPDARDHSPSARGNHEPPLQTSRLDIAAHLATDVRYLPDAIETVLAVAARLRHPEYRRSMTLDTLHAQEDKTVITWKKLTDALTAHDPLKGVEAAWRVVWEYQEFLGKPFEKFWRQGLKSYRESLDELAKADMPKAIRVAKLNAIESLDFPCGKYTAKCAEDLVKIQRRIKRAPKRRRRTAPQSPLGSPTT